MPTHPTRITLACNTKAKETMKQIWKMWWAWPLLLLSCGEAAHTPSTRTLQVNLKEASPVGWQELFARMEVIPLETNDNCLLMSIDKIRAYKDSLYVFDERREALYVFGKGGGFVRQISRRGQGPGEYTRISDFVLDNERKEIWLLAPYGYCLAYGLGGNYLRKTELPAKPNYQSITILPDGNYALWSCVEEEEEGITLTDMAGAYLNGYWHNDRIIDFMQLRPFYEYEGRAYFATAFDNPVYEVTSDTMKPAYRWDFGDRNVDAQKLAPYLDIANSSERNRQLLEALEEGALPFCMERQSENSCFYYVALRPGVGRDRAWINVFYDKQEDRPYVFEETSEGIPVRPILLTDTYVLSVLQAEDFPSLRHILPADEYASLTARDEEDNPCLLKLYF